MLLLMARASLFVIIINSRRGIGLFVIGWESKYIQLLALYCQRLVLYCVCAFVTIVFCNYCVL